MIIDGTAFFDAPDPDMIPTTVSTHPLAPDDGSMVSLATGRTQSRVDHHALPVLEDEQQSPLGDGLPGADDARAEAPLVMPSPTLPSPSVSTAARDAAEATTAAEAVPGASRDGTFSSWSSLSSESSPSVTSSCPPASPQSLGLSNYSSFMLRYTKRQLDATPGSPPPPHIHVAGPAGSRHRFHHHHDFHGQPPLAQDHTDHQQHPENRNHTPASPHLPNGTTPTMPDGVHTPTASR